MSRAEIGERRRQLILDTIAALTAREGRPPTIREVGDVLGMASTGHVAYHVHELRRRRMLTPGDRSARCLQIVRP